ncbi:MAG: hypothetical protein ACREBD_26010, partial [Blastocatellia bacterium]
MNTRSDQNSQFSSTLPMILTGIAALLVVVILGSAIGKSAKGQASKAEGEKRALVEKIRTLADRPLFTDNSEQGPLFIQSAGVKEVAGAEYQLLTRSTSEASRALIIVSAIGGGLRKSSFLIFLSYIFLLAKPKQENVGQEN